MYKQLNLALANGETKDFAFLTCGTTSVRYKMLFGDELLSSITSIIGSAGPGAVAKIMSTSQKAASNGNEDIDLGTLDPDTLQAFISIAGSGKLDTISKMAYVMNQQAAGADMKKLSVDSYLDWLEQFETMEFLTHALDFIGLYMSGRDGTSALKKSPAPSIVK